MSACDATLLTDASSLDTLTEQQLLAVIACQLAQQNGMPCDATLLEDASCLVCLNPQQLLAIIACLISQGSGGGVIFTQEGAGPPGGGTATTPPFYSDITTLGGPYFYVYINGTWQPV